LGNIARQDRRVGRERGETCDRCVGACVFECCTAADGDVVGVLLRVGMGWEDLRFGVR